MVSIGFDEVTGLNGLSFTVRSVLGGRIHQITRAAMRRSDLHMLHDAPGGVFVALDEAPVGSLLPYEHVLLVAVQRVDGLWVLRGMRIGAYFSAMRVENEDAVKHGSAKQAVLDAQQMVGDMPSGNVATAKPRRIGSTETTVAEWVRGVERRYLAMGYLWSSRGDGTEGLGMPQLQFVVGGDFATADALAVRGEGSIAEVRLELRDVGDELALLSPAGHDSPPLEQQPADGASLALLDAGAGPEMSPIAAMPMLRLEGTSPSLPALGAPPQPPGLSGLHPPSAQASVVSLGDLSAGLPPQYGAYDFTAYHAVDVSGLARLTEARKLGLAQIGVPPPCIAFMAEAGVSMDNVADLPWETLEGLVREVSGVGRVQLALLQAMHARLQAELEAKSGRSSKSSSRTGSHTGSKSGARSRVSQQDVGQHQRQCTAAAAAAAAASPSGGLGGPGHLSPRRAR